MQETAWLHETADNHPNKYIVIVLSNVTACQCPCNLKLHRESQSSSTGRSIAKNLMITMWWAHCTDGPGQLNMRLQPCRRESRTEACTKLLSDAVTQLTIQRYNSKGQAQSIEAKQIKLSYVTRWQVPCRRLLQEEPSAPNNDTALNMPAPLLRPAVLRHSGHSCKAHSAGQSGV